MSTRAERAKEFFQNGYACSQAVAMAFSDVVKIEDGVLAKIMLPFGGGFGRLRLVCGAVSGMTAIAGLIFGEENASAENKATTYEIERELCARFEKEMGSLICAELLSGANLTPSIGGSPETRTENYYKKRPCGEIVFLATKILEDYLIERGVI
jgi:C_GCAxxG_C_C family probable redox protein